MTIIRQSYEWDGNGPKPVDWLEPGQTYHSATIASGSEAEMLSYFNTMHAYGQSVNQSQFDYSFLIQNSNTAVKEMVESAGLDFALPKYSNGSNVWAPAYDHGDFVHDPQTDNLLRWGQETQGHFVDNTLSTINNSLSWFDSNFGNGSKSSAYFTNDFTKSFTSLGFSQSFVNDFTANGWLSAGSYNSYLDDYSFNLGGSNYTLFGENDGISLSSISNGSAYGGYDWTRDSSYNYGGTNYFRPTSTIYDGLSFMGSALNHYSPLALDLDGDGIETAHIYDDARVYFDIDNDAFAERVGWIKPDDGLLALDRDGNGNVDNVTELFGDYRMEAWDELKLLDTNNDNQITSLDAKFNDLRIWRDLNQNGISEAGELQSLSFYNITQINITHNVMDVYQKENYISGSSTVTISHMEWRVFVLVSVARGKCYEQQF